jgi:hypothetical protein
MRPFAKSIERSSKLFLFAEAAMCAVVACTLVSIFPARAADSNVPDYSGTWQIAADGASFHAHPLCIFQQAGNRITGTCKGGSNIGTGEGIAGGDNFEFMWEGMAYIPGGECLCTFTGKRVSAIKITGTIESRGDAVPFEATKQN